MMEQELIEIYRRLERIEGKIDNLMAFKWMLIGQASIVSLLVSLIVAFVR